MSDIEEVKLNLNEPLPADDVVEDKEVAEVTDEVKAEEVVEPTEEPKEEPKDEPVLSKREQEIKLLMEREHISAAEAQKALNDHYNPNIDPSDPNYKTVRHFLDVGELNKLKSELKNNKKTVEDLLDKFQQSRKEGYEEALAKLRAEKNEAVLDSDVDRFRELDSKYEEVYQKKLEQDRELQQRTEEENQVPPQQEVDPAVINFVNKHTWYADPNNPDKGDYVMSRTADAIYDKIVASDPNQTINEVLHKVETEMAKRFPEHENFSNRNREVAKEEIKSDVSTRTSDEVKYSELSSVDKELYQSWKKAVKIIGGDYSVAAYMKEIKEFGNE